MGRVINYKKIGGKPVAGEKNKLVFKAVFEGETDVVDAFLVKQIGTIKYRLSKIDESKVEDFVMIPTSDIASGQCFLYGNLDTSEVFASKLTQNRFSNPLTGTSKYYVGEVPEGEVAIAANASLTDEDDSDDETDGN